MREPRIQPEVRRMRVYRERNRILKAMGFPSYAAYLQSDLWKSIRRRVLESNPKCSACGRPATQAHHRSYRKPDLDGRDLSRIYAVCASCHRTSEFRAGDGAKLNPAQATTKLQQLRAKKSPPSAPLDHAERAPSKYVEVPIDPTKITMTRGEYVGPVNVGDWVRVVGGEVGRVLDIRQANYLPRFRVGNRWVGKTKLRTKLAPVN